MSEKHTVATEDHAGFTIEFSYLDHWCDVTAYEISATGNEGKRYYQRKDSGRSPDLVETIEEAEQAVGGYIKWDGCSELNMGCPHWCGPCDYKKHIALLEALYKRAQALMPSGNDDPWDEP